MVLAEPVLLTKDDARELVNRIRLNVEDLKELIVRAYKGRADVVLGYTSWTEFCDQEFGGQIAIPKSERADLVFSLREHGLSTRAIGSAIGVSQGTVRNDLTEQDCSVDTVTSLDGRERPARRRRRDEDDVVEAELVDEDETAAWRGRPTDIVDAVIVNQEGTADYCRFRDAIETILTTPRPETLCQQGPLIPSRVIDEAIGRLIAYTPQRIR